MSYTSSQTALPPLPECEIVVGESLFAWRGAGIVLFGERDGINWVLARGWRSGDRLTDIRRWVFAESDRFVGQVRRLVFDATTNSPLAVDAANAAAGWVLPHALDHSDTL